MGCFAKESILSDALGEKKIAVLVGQYMLILDRLQDLKRKRAERGSREA
jgi:hypothetical protein